MVALSRRDALRAGIGVATGVGLAGCSSGPELLSFRFEELRALNTHGEPHTVSLLLLEDDEPVFRSTVDLGAAEESDSSSTAADSARFESIPSEPGRYELYAWLQQGSHDEWTRFAVDAGEVDGADEPLCAAVILTIESLESGPEPIFWRNLACEA
jgi:hypothetical protein